MLDRIPPVGPQDVQTILTVTLVATTAILALLCDMVRYRIWRTRVVSEEHSGSSAAEMDPGIARTAISPTLVPQELVHPAEDAVRSSGRASRLAASLKQPRRSLSPGVAAAIAKGKQAARKEPLPVGYQSRVVLDRLIAQNAPFTGLAVAIRAVGKEEAGPGVLREAVGQVMGTTGMAASLDGTDSILLIPGLSEWEARQQMGVITRHLWDTQIRTLATYGVSFQWGSVDVQEEALQQVVRMAQDQIGTASEVRRTPPPQSAPRRLRQAV